MLELKSKNLLNLIVLHRNRPSFEFMEFDVRREWGPRDGRIRVLNEFLPCFGVVVVYFLCGLVEVLLYERERIRVKFVIGYRKSEIESGKTYPSRLASLIAKEEALDIKSFCDRIANHFVRSSAIIDLMRKVEIDRVDSQSFGQATLRDKFHPYLSIHGSDTHEVE